MLEMYCKNLPLSKDLDPQESIHGEELLSMACNVLIQVSYLVPGSSLSRYNRNLCMFDYLVVHGSAVVLFMAECSNWIEFSSFVAVCKLLCKMYEVCMSAVKLIQHFFLGFSGLQHLLSQKTLDHRSFFLRLIWKQFAFWIVWPPSWNIPSYKYS